MIDSYKPFEGDGRTIVEPIPCPEETRAPQRPMAVSRAQARHLIDGFMKMGSSTHSASGETLWVIVAWCKRQRVPYRIVEQFVAGQHAGFWVKKTEGEAP